MAKEPAKVIGFTDDGRVVIEYRNNISFVVEREISDVEIGDVVAVDNDTAVEVISSEPYEISQVGVVKEVYDEKVAVNTGQMTTSISRPDFEIEPGYTVEFIAPGILVDILSDEPIELTTTGQEKSEPTKQEPEQVRDISYDDIGGLNSVIESVREIIQTPLELSDEDLTNISPAKGVLFYGEPGTGKTLLAEAIANETMQEEGGETLSFFSIQGPEIVSKYYGESEGQIRSYFEAAEKHSPAILFIDEIESIAPRRDRAQETERRIVAQLLTMMQGLEKRNQTIVIGATNFIDAVDPALRRPGRFGEEIEFPLPDTQDRVEILQVKLESFETGDDINIQQIAKNTNGWNGAELDRLVNKAAIFTKKEGRQQITKGDLAIAYEQLKMIRDKKIAAQQQEKTHE